MGSPSDSPSILKIGMIIDHPGRTGNQNQTPVEETGPARIHSDPSHGNLGAHLQTQYHTAQPPGVIGGGYPPHHHHHQMIGLSSAGTSLPSGMYRSVSTPSSTTMDYPPAAGGGVYAQDHVQIQHAQFRPPEMMDTTAPPTGMTALKHPPPAFDLHVSEHKHPHPLQHVDPFRHHSGDVKPFGLDFNVFEPSNPGEPVSSPPSMQELEQQRLLQDLAMKQGELVRKEEEIDRLRMALEEANSDKSKVYSEKLGEAEQFKQNIRELEKMLRTKNEEVNGLIFELQHFHVQMENIQAAKPFDEKEFYRMDKNPHGICVIINNHQFYHPTDPDKAHLNRGGAEVDQKNLKLTFEYLRYKVEIYENLTHDRMTDLMMSMAQRNHANYDSFICCILTHGEQDKVHGADSIPVSLLDMTGVMKMCKTLVNKPKMFFIQACRGDLEDKGHKLDEEEVTQRDSGGKQPPSAHTIPQEADFFFGYATPLGNAAYRSRRHGSWYISELCKVLTRHAYTSNLSNMMRKVNDNICQAFTKEGYKQTAEFVDRLRKGVHFFHFSKVQQQQQLQHAPPQHR